MNLYLISWPLHAVARKCVHVKEICRDQAATSSATTFSEGARWTHRAVLVAARLRGHRFSHASAACTQRGASPRAPRFENVSSASATTRPSIPRLSRIGRLSASLDSHRPLMTQTPPSFSRETCVRHAVESTSRREI